MKHSSIVKKNQIIPLSITGVTQEGAGVGRYQGLAVFVPMTAPGDELEVKIVKVLSRHAFGIVHQLLTPAPCREEPGCPVYARCGGCSLRHITYEEELRVKHGWVQENLRRIGGLALTLDAPIPSPHTRHYRNKAQYPIRRVNGQITAGFYAKRSHTLIPAEDCPLQPPLFGRVAGLVCRFLEEQGLAPYDEKTHTGLVRHLYLRVGEETGELMVCLVVNGKKLPGWEALLALLQAEAPGLASLCINSNTSATNVILGPKTWVLWGSDTITDRLCGVELSLSPQAFYQVNQPAAQALYRQALEYAAPGPDDILLDLYCGAGAIGLSMAHAAGQVVGVEVVEQAVENARENARRGGIANARFFCGDAGQAAARLAQEGLNPTIIVLDPPRKGLDSAVIEACVQMSPQKIVYISCDSATLARDLGAFAAQGYQAVQGRAVDLFPRTAHVEAVMLLERNPQTI